MSRGGASPSPTPTPAASVWANAACTERPVVGQSYVDLYVRLGRAFGFGQGKDWGDPSDEGSFLIIGAPSEFAPDPYNISLYVDMYSETYNEPFAAGQVVLVNSSSEIEITESFVFDFYDE